MKIRRSERILRYVLLGCGVLMILLPLYMTLITALKTTAENTASFFALPRSLYLGNFMGVLQRGGYPRAFANTVYITAGVIMGNLILMPALSYAVSRSMRTSLIYRFVYYFILLGIFIPFEVKMMPLVKLMSWLHLLHPTGFILLCISSSTCEAVFLYVGFLRSIPTDMEEAACIDGAGTFQTYTRIVFPLLQPMMVTVIIRNGLWIWNDFMLPLVTLNRSSAFWTLTLFQYNFKTEYTTDYSLSFASFCMSMIPIVIFYIIMQKHIIGGLTSGAVKS
ncbi:MAG: carbohydrate ABC transporter permease [Treponema sp.]|jgi:raffinose/stachyose/melibiose transport system permease protein|nr:carbohydrate ABC transporter permease [Treponema sp.]